MTTHEAGRIKNYYIYKAEWIPDSPVKTFNGFVEHLVVSECIQHSKIEALSQAYERKYGYKLPLFILHPILSQFEKNGYAQKNRNEWYFDLPYIPLHDYDSVSSEFLYNYNELVNGFMSFKPEKKLTYDEAESIINDFIDDNNLNLRKIAFEDQTFNGDRYLLAQYLKELSSKKQNVYDFLLKLCEAMLIKSYIINDAYVDFSFANKIIVLDTPIVLRALGYAGDYLKEEYQFLLKCLSDSNCRLEIFEHTFVEVYNILYSAKDWVENVNFEMARASDVCLYFRAKGYTEKDVVEIIERLKTDLENLNIYLIDDGQIDWKLTKFVEDEKKIEALLRENYGGSYIREDSIKIDIKSVMAIYLIRKNNKNKVLRETTHFFLTSNGTLSKVVSIYNSKAHPKTISPVATDMFIGMLACGENIGRAKSMVNNRVLSYCYSGFRPSIAMREKYIEIVENHKDQLPKENYLLLKNHPLVCDVLISCSESELSNVTEVTLWDVLNEVKSALVSDTTEHYRTLIAETTATHGLAMEEKDKQIAEMKKDQEAARKKHLQELHDKDLKIAQRDWNKWKKHAKIMKYVFIILALVFIAGSVLAGINVSNENVTVLAICIVGSIISIFLSALAIISWFENSKIVAKIYKRAKMKIAKENSISAEELK